MPKEKASEKHDLGIRNPYIDLEPFLAEEQKNADTWIKNKSDDVYERVCEALYQHHDIDASQIIVSVKNGEVTLSGKVPDRNMKWTAESCVADVSGVRQINNELKVSGSGKLNIVNH